MQSSPRLIINLDAVRHNYRTLDGLCETITAACVKADCYGLGADQIVPVLYNAGCRHFFVATSDEGREVSEILLNDTDALPEDVNIYVFNGPLDGESGRYTAYGLIPVINSMPQAERWAQWNNQRDVPSASVLHIDTGMNRLGLSLADWHQLKSSSLMAELKVRILMSHLACAYQEAHEMNARQLAVFKDAVVGQAEMRFSLANSGGALLGSDYHFDMVRPGIALYGGTPGFTKRVFESRPVIRVEAPILQIRRIKAGETIGYDATFKAEKDMIVAVTAIGYADGVMRTGSNQIFGRMVGHKCPSVGRISMDLTIFDVTGLEEHLEDSSTISLMEDDLEEQAAASRTISYELLTRLGNRFEREYV